ncbi:hypothetical protein BX598_0190 [Micrococcaceae bacterium JKS001869]|nr:hypothetical protein BX598_0190 [Micrococcaceae bacterium JKS001869]
MAVPVTPVVMQNTGSATVSGNVQEHARAAQGRAAGVEAA